MDNEKLTQILNDHKLWLANNGGCRADLSDADLSCANLRCADLRCADLRCADLSRANLRCANLRDADLSRADLSCANLSSANLRCADLSRADLSRADLRGADLSSANLRGADLSRADLRGANLDYSCLPLWCGSLRVNFDDKQIIQIAYHLCSAGLYSENTSKEIKDQLSKIVDLANQFHRVRECGFLRVSNDE